MTPMTGVLQREEEEEIHIEEGVVEELLQLYQPQWPATGAALTALVATAATRPVALTAVNQVQNLAVVAQISWASESLGNCGL